ncbi:hypothetical protein LJR255_000942 [Pararhizobium sp. LjRoot255]|uniref:hypothetical protein n=1 Tax=Pararhizobium sp. LjRoot255 TaxID=3342298 RepID=UPI003ED0C2BF
MKPDNLMNGGDQFLTVCRADMFVPQSMTFSELEDEFPPFPPSYCVITDRDDL